MRPTEADTNIIMVPEALLGMPGRNARKEGSTLSCHQSAFPFQTGHYLQSNSGLCAPFLTQGQGLGGSESPYTCLTMQPPSDYQGPELWSPQGSAGQMDGLLLSLCWFPREGHLPGGSRGRERRAQGLTKMIAGETKRQQIWKKKGGGNPSIIWMSWK